MGIEDEFTDLPSLSFHDDEYYKTINISYTGLGNQNDDYYVEKIKELEISDSSLNKLLPEYNKNIQLLEDSLKHRHYTLFIVWSFIFFLIFLSFLFTLLEIKDDINLMLRMIIYIFIIYVLYYVFNNVINYIKKYV